MEKKHFKNNNSETGRDMIAEEGGWLGLSCSHFPVLTGCLQKTRGGGSGQRNHWGGELARNDCRGVYNFLSAGGYARNGRKKCHRKPTYWGPLKYREMPPHAFVGFFF